jgi:zinc transporter 2
MFITAICGLIANLIMGTVLHTDGASVEAQSIRSHHSHHNHSHSHDHKHKSIGNLEDNEQQKKDKNAKQVEDTVAASRENYNMQAAMIHVIGDIVQSVGVVIASIVIWTDPNLKWFDPICTLMFAVLVMCTTIPITGDCLSVLMEASPPGEDWGEFQDKMQKLPGVVKVLDFHVWSLASGKPCLSAHIISTNVERTLRKATNMCRRNKIFHTTI